MAKKKGKGERKTLSVNFKTPFVVGHKYGALGGRPQEIDYDAQADLLDAWASKDDSIHLYTFVKDKKYCAQDLTDFAKRSDKFALSLRRAKEAISYNRERLVSKGELHPTAWNRSASLYDRPLFEHEESVKDSQAERDKKIAQTSTENLATIFGAARSGDIKQPD